ncbi:MAG: IMP cyclohydrolase [Clostridia bacterium]|nr:IMP cyclohydrolase [Clostridia bacterium]
MTIREALAFTYPGRGILCGLSPDGENALCAYFIMGRSANSRNRVFVPEGQDLIIHPADPSKVEDPSLIIYAPVRALGNALIVTNGDQTDTIKNGLLAGRTFEQALESRTFEPDAPNFTPRISAIMTFSGAYAYKLSILKSPDGKGETCSRFTYHYEAVKGEGHLIHTYLGDGNPLPSFTGEPKKVDMPNGLDAFTDEVWNALDKDNRISLFTRAVNLKDHSADSRVINRFAAL